MKDTLLWAVGWLLAFIGLLLIAPFYPIFFIGDLIYGDGDYYHHF